MSNASHTFVNVNY